MSLQYFKCKGHNGFVINKKNLNTLQTQTRLEGKGWLGVSFKIGNINLLSLTLGSICLAKE